jgi:gamma-glutamyl:cysteine ligase YbdK (ATP-grasp superfamily)
MLADAIVALVKHAPEHSANRADYLQNRWAAARLGLDAALIHPDGDRLGPARELAADVLGAEPPEPEALLQLHAGVSAAAADLVDRTLG